MDPDHFFDREASIHLASRYGTLYAGRLGELKGSVGSVGFFANEANPFGSGWGEVIGGIAPYGAQSVSHLNNAIAYVSPEIQGVTLYAQYSGGQDNVQNQSIADRTYALGAKFKHGPLTIAGVLDTTQVKTSKAYSNYSSLIRGRIKNYHLPRKNPLTLNLAANLELQDWKLFASMQMFKNVRNINQSITGDWIPPYPIRPSELFYMAQVIDSLFYNGPNAYRMMSLSLNNELCTRPGRTTVNPACVFTLANTINESIKYNGLSLTTGFTAPLGRGKLYASVGFLKAKTYTYAIRKVELAKVTRIGFGLGYLYPLSRRTDLYAATGGIFDRWSTPVVSSKASQHLLQAGVGLTHRF